MLKIRYWLFNLSWLLIRFAVADTVPTDTSVVRHASGLWQSVAAQSVSTCATPASTTETHLYAATYQFSWTPTAPVQSYVFRRRQVGTLSWATETLSASNTAIIRELLPPYNYGNGIEWQVAAVCNGNIQSDFTSARSFTVSCPTPISLTEATSLTAAQLRWQSYTGSIDDYTVQWRATGGIWTTSNTYSSSFLVAPLTPGSTYEWRVKTNCYGVGESIYSLPRSFTAQCSPEAAVSYSTVSATGAYIQWTAPFRPDGYILRWRAVGNTGVWSESPLIVGTFSPGNGTLPTGSYSITGLTNATTYDLQIRKQCNGGLTDWSSNILTFTTYCAPIVASSIDVQATSARLVATPSPGSVYVFEWQADMGQPISQTASVPTLPLTGLLPNTGYTFRVKARCGTGTETAFSTPVGFFTNPAADLALRLTTSHRTPAVGAVVTLTATITNRGPQAVNIAQVVSYLPPNMLFVGSASSAVTYQAGTVTLTTGTLAKQSQASYAFEVQVVQSGTYRMAAEIKSASLEDTDSTPGTGTADGEDDSAHIDFRTRNDDGLAMFVSPNPNPRVLPPVQSNQPLPTPTEADLSLSLIASHRTQVANAPLTLSATVSNRGSLDATNIAVKLTLPTGWVITDPTGLTIDGQTVTLLIPDLTAGVAITINVPVNVAGSGEQVVRGVITAADQTDTDSAHTNGYGLGEDDEATAWVRVR
jgi:uncharacterized repeat protein (TIGR01451 family)